MLTYISYYRDVLNLHFSLFFGCREFIWNLCS